ncbi:MAG: FtsX-like permease family protein, partial [Bryobacteraceae bacterium]
SGLAPALQAPKDDVNPALHEGGRTQTGGRGQSRLRWLLVATEVALSLALLVGSGLLIRSFDRLANVDRGFQSQNRVLFTVSLPNQTKPERVWQVVEQFRQRAQTLPEIISVAGSSSRLITGASTGMGIIPVGREGAFGKNIPWAQWRMITPGYLETIGVTLKKGRLFDAHDQIAKPWRVLISQRLATTLFQGSDPIGHQVALWAGQNIRPAEVIGVVGDMRERGLASDPILAVYIPQNGAGQTSVEFVAHTRGDAVQAIPRLRAVLAEVDPTLPLSDVQSIDHLVNSSLAPNRFRTVVLSVFGALALLLAVTGVYGVLAYSVSRRTPEFGLRLALGASPRSLLLMTVSQGMRPVIAGIVLGAGLASLLSSYLATLLFGIQELDWPTYGAVAVLVSITAFLACCLPALRATKVDPAVALRAE